jgi:hypothetical protein
LYSLILYRDPGRLRLTGQGTSLKLIESEGCSRDLWNFSEPIAAAAAAAARLPARFSRTRRRKMW